MALLLHPVYFPNCLSMAALVQDTVVWEVCDNFQKQTFRNRCYIATDQGPLLLNLPISHVGGVTGRQAYRDVRIASAAAWQRHHWRSLETAYRTAPFFEFYEEDLRPLFQRPFQFLMDLNLQTIACLCALLGIAFPDAKSAAYLLDPSPLADARMLVSAKAAFPVEFPPYPQVFMERCGFLPNLSTLDLLFNEGPAAADYLKALKMPWNG